MKIISVSSGSEGNMYIIESQGDVLLLEAGLPAKELKRALWDNGYSLSDIDYCLISHEHSDHFKSAKYLIDHRVKICVPYTKDILWSFEDMLNKDKVIYLEDKELVVLGNYKAIALKMDHDDIPTLGYLILHQPTDTRLFYATDTKYIKYNPKRVNYFMVEVNYQEKYLEQSVKEGDMKRGNMRRVMRSHMSLNTAVNFLDNTDLGRAEEIWLVHTSARNCNKSEVKDKVQSEFGIPTFIA